jgi:O-antigen/teichoic acid export membrane protein
MTNGSTTGASLRTSFSWTLAGNVVYAACQWAMLAALAKVTTVEEVGRFAFALSVTAPVFMLSNLQLRSIQATDRPGDVPFSRYLRLRVGASALSCLALLLPALLHLYPPATGAAVVWLTFARAAESLSDVHYGLFQQRERMDWVAHSLIARGVTGLGALTLAVTAGASAGGAASALALAWTVCLVALDVPRARRLESRAERTGPASRSGIRNLVWTALPLGVVMMLVSLNVNIPRYAIQWQLGVQDLGLFAALSSLLTASQMVSGALGQSATPRMARLARARDAAGFRRVLGRQLLFGTVLGLAGVGAAAAVGRPVVTLLFTAEYAARQDVLLVVAAAAAVATWASYLGYAMTALRVFRPQVPVFVTVTLATIAASVLLVPRSGILGAAWVLVVSGGTQCFVSWLVMRYSLRQMTLGTVDA